MCGCHEPTNNKQPQATNASSLSSPQLLRHQDYFIPYVWLPCDRESRSPKLSSLAILHQERVNKVFGNRSSRPLARFFKFFITARLPLRRTHAMGHRLQRELRQADCHLHPIIVVKEPQVTYDFSSQIMSYILNILICVGMILLDNLLQ
jgi:hypothetical protein